MRALAWTAGEIRRRGDLKGGARLVVTGRLDAATGRHLALLCAQIVAQWPQGLAVDLTAISDATDGGVDALASAWLWASVAAGHRRRGRHYGRPAGVARCARRL